MKNLLFLLLLCSCTINRNVYNIYPKEVIKEGFTLGTSDGIMRLPIEPTPDLHYPMGEYYQPYSLKNFQRILNDTNFNTSHFNLLGNVVTDSILIDTTFYKLIH